MIWAAGGLVLGVLAMGVHFARRNNQEMHAWLASDPYARRRWARVTATSVAALLCALAWMLSQRIPPGLGRGAGDTVLVIDVSRSMRAQDVPPSRLRRAARLAERLVAQESGQRVGLVLFAGDAFAALPLTLDRDAALPYLRALDTELISRRGSDVARALEVAARLFDAESERPRRILLMSDGEHAGPPLAGVLSRLRTAGIRISVVGLGTPLPVALPADRDSQVLVDAAGREVRSALQADLLREIAREGSGRYWDEWRERPSEAEIGNSLQRSAAASSSGSESFVRVLALLVFCLLALEWRASMALAPRARVGRPGPALALLVGALLTLGASYEEQLLAADHALEEGDAQSALRIYRGLEDSRKPHPDLELRIGNALYRLGRFEEAAAYYLALTRADVVSAPRLRFRAQFNLGNAFAELGRYGEAANAFFAALREQPGHRETLFNYEWVLERVEAGGGGEGELDPSADSEEALAALPSDGAGSSELAPMGDLEAERWLAGLEDRLDDVLRDQIERELSMSGQEGEPPGGQAW